MLSNRTEALKETLGASPIPEAAHAAPARSGRLMVVFCAVIHAGGRDKWTRISSA